MQLYLNFFLFVLISDTLFAEVVFNSVYVNLLHIHQFIKHSKQNIHLLIIRTAHLFNFPEDLHCGTGMLMLDEIWFTRECAKHSIQHFIQISTEQQDYYRYDSFFLVI